MTAITALLTNRAYRLPYARRPATQDAEDPGMPAPDEQRHGDLEASALWRNVK